MKITFKLYASLTVYLPEAARRDNQMPMDLPDGATVGQVIEPLGMPPKLVHLVLVNGVYIQPEHRLTHVLKPDDVLAIWPPIAGG